MKINRMNSDFILWSIFWLVFFGVLFLDLFVLFRGTREVDVKKALKLSAVWVSIALIYSILIFNFKGGKLGVEYITAYFVELSLSVDNLFVFLVIFSFFNVPKEYQHKVLFWGVLGAIVFRGIFIILGVSLVEMFSWLFIVFGLFLIYTSFLILTNREENVKGIENKLVYKVAKRIFNVTSSYVDGKFFVNINGKLWVTPLFLCLLVIEATDVMFAVDSVPAVLGISTNILVVYTSNIFAVMGLRSMYFALAGIMGVFKFLKYGLSIILSYIGFKMILKEILHLHIDSLVSLLIIVLIIFVSIILSLIFKEYPVQPQK
ncbi:MAG: TerC/Alx family metal homeostasis membrane protein [Brevinematia bacterium]